MLQLKPEIQLALKTIDFIERYKNLSVKYSFDLKESFEKFDNNEVIRLIEEMGYNPSYDKKENFFKIVDEVTDFKFQFNISLKYGAVECIWSVWKETELQMGSPWGVMKKLLDDKVDDKVRKPIFRNYEDLKGILKEALGMYEDFKRELLANL